MHVDQARIRYQELRDLGYSQPVPCTVEEVEELEHWIGRRLPEAYREFLLWMGHSGGGFLGGSNCFYEDLKDLQTNAQELLEEDHCPEKLPADAFVFFLLDEGDDPPVYWYIMEEPVRTRFDQLYPCYSDFLLTEIEGHIRPREKMQAEEKRWEYWQEQRRQQREELRKRIQREKLP